MNEPKWNQKKRNWDNIKSREEQKEEAMPKLHVYAAGCAWSGPKSAVGKTEGQMSIPCCPHCGSVLFQTGEKEWWAGAEKHDRNGHTNYLEFLKWKEAKPRCWPTLKEAAASFTEETGKPVVLGQ